MKKKKVLEIIGTVLVILIILAMLFIAGFNIYQRVTYKEFFKAANPQIKIPDLAGGITPQGF